MLVSWMLCVALAEEPVQESVDEPEDRERIFMPAFETGLIWSEDPDVGVGTTFRTSVEWRQRRISAPFLRISYDATTARYEQRNVGGLASVTSGSTTHDLLAGGGLRFGPRELQLVPSLQAGLQIAEIPEVRVTDEGLVLQPRTQSFGLAVGAFGLEWYVDDDAALTLEATGRVRFDADTRPGLAGGLTIGVTTAI